MTGSAPLSTHAILERTARGDATHDGRGDATTLVPGGDATTRVVTLDRHFQGLPDTAHGGTVLALFDAVAPATGARTIRGLYRRRVPLATPLQLVVAPDRATTRFTLSEGTAVLVEGLVDTVSASARRGAEGDVPGAGGRAPLGPVGSRLRPLPTSDVGARPPAPGTSLSAPGGTSPLPISKTCFACGIDNPLGLQVQLAIDDHRVAGRWMPHPGLRAADGTIAPVAVTTLLDEAAFWLGAAASGEAGMTTDLRVHVHGPLPKDGAVVVAGPRATVRPHADDARYWDTEIDAWDDAGRPVASARITFVAVRGAARKLVTGLLAMNPPEVLRRIFPAYVS